MKNFTKYLIGEEVLEPIGLQINNVWITESEQTLSTLKRNGAYFIWHKTNVDK